ncbi:hypothetical protein [Tersicoccus sp. Bi-70]|uniref:hypothetical protein n=1 Tax=Tersicoccus sp. Bi-70 TaxID=1897634 RepID=UPI0009F8FC6A|nr:hypothetical protein [Tersicoccus sp. Bi-70]
MTSTQLRLPRAAAVITAMMVLAVGAHALGGGVLPPVPILVAVTVVALIPATLLAGRQLTLTVLGSLLVAGQFVLHLVFTRLAVPGAAVPTNFLVGHDHHGGHDAAASVDLAGAGDVVTVSPSVPMMLLHLAATLATAAILARGEAALIALLGWLRPLLQVPAPARLPVAPPSTAPPAAPALPRRVALRLPGRRGPPRSPAR